MKYSIEWLERKETSTGKTKYDATLKNEAGVVTEKVTIWDSFPNFSDLKPGTVIDCDVVTKQNGKYTNVTAYPSKNPNGTTRPQGMKAAQERKAEMIEKAQERKSESIAFFNATNNAIVLLEAYNKNAEYPFSPEGAKKFITEWREWFLTEWQKYEAGDKTDKHNPF